jgi:hypothetical protein
MLSFRRRLVQVGAGEVIFERNVHRIIHSYSFQVFNNCIVSQLLVDYSCSTHVKCAAFSSPATCKQKFKSEGCVWVVAKGEPEVVDEIIQNNTQTLLRLQHNASRVETEPK